MMVVDASAILAILLEEPEGPAFRRAIARARAAKISPVNLWEVLVRAQGRYGTAGVAEAHTLLADLTITCDPATGDDAVIAFEASVRFGRGTPARLNLGDCFAYALAMREGEGLLYKGDDFPHTDVKPVLADQG